MGQEIRNQIQGMQGQGVQVQGIHDTKKPLHFTFEDTINQTFDKIYQGERYRERNEQHDACRNNNSSSNKRAISPSTLERRIEKLEESLLDKETQLKAQQEKARKDLKYCEQQYKEKNQVERLHYENSQSLLKRAHEEEIRKVKKEIAQVKSDARLIIDFIRRKASEALAEENSKVEHQKKSIGKRMEAMEAEMKKTFHDHLVSLEEEVKKVVKKERTKAIDLQILPPPPPKNISILPKRKSNTAAVRRHWDDSIPSDETEAPALCSDDSISTCRSDEISSIDIKKIRDTETINEHEILRSRVQELEEWTDTLTLALRTGAKIKGSPMNSNPKPFEGSR